MYRINEIGRNVLITVDEVMTKAAIDQSADIRFLISSIEIAEERYIVPILGEDFYEDFINTKNVVVTTGNQAALLELINTKRAGVGKNAVAIEELLPGMVVNAIELTSEVYKALWDRYLWKITAEAVDILAMVPSWLRTTAQGQQLNAPQTIGGITEGSASGNRQDVQFKVDSMVQNRLLPMIERMKKWLCDNAAWYPLYDDCGCSKNDGISERKGGIIMGIYDDEPVHRPAAVTPRAKPAPRKQECQIRVLIKEEPDEYALYMLCNLKTIPKEYPSGMTLTIPHLIGKTILWPVYINNDVYADMPFDSETGAFDNTEYGGFSDGNKVLIKYIETL